MLVDIVEEREAELLGHHVLKSGQKTDDIDADTRTGGQKTDGATGRDDKKVSLSDIIRTSIQTYSHLTALSEDDGQTCIQRNGLVQGALELIARYAGTEIQVTFTLSIVHFGKYY